MADDQGVVHSFSLESGARQNFLIIHRTWTVSNGWSAPVVVLLPDYLGMAPALESVSLNAAGMIHLACSACNPTQGDIYHSNVRSVRRWVLGRSL